MKIFAVYSVVTLEGKTAELKTFREKYDQPYKLHITLKQPVQINEDEVDEVKQILSGLDVAKSKIKLVFDKINGDEKVLMLMAEENSTLMDLQKEVVGLLHKYKSYVDADTMEYEINFKPHITVARDIHEQDMSSVKEQLRGMLPVKAFINSITLAVVNHISPEEALDPNNLTEYRFQHPLTRLVR